MARKQIEVGKTYKWEPKPAKGRDGKTYPVYTVMEGGRGWYERAYYTPVVSLNDNSITVKIVDIDAHDGSMKAEIVAGGTNPVNRFNKRPYTRKDGTFHQFSYAIRGGEGMRGVGHYSLYIAAGQKLVEVK
jgi:hypothetical protein